MEEDSELQNLSISNNNVPKRELESCNADNSADNVYVKYIPVASPVEGGIVSTETFTNGREIQGLTFLALRLPAGVESYWMQWNEYTLRQGYNL